jgi:hypothetical protein
MKAIIGLLLFITVRGMAQSGDSLAALYFRQADTASRRIALWQAPLYGPMLLVDPGTRVTYANMPDSAGVFSPLPGGIYKGILPRDVMIANTAIHWQGQTWAVILWPLPDDRDTRVNLLLHESFHRIQDAIGLPANSPTVNHLATMQGRIYFLLELQALKAALGKPVDQRQADLAQALGFREKRQQLFPATFDKERILEMNEGLAEYTGMVLGRPAETIRQHLYQQIDSAAYRLSLVRAMAYFTGPVYGYLLYEQAPGWTQAVDSNASFPALISRYYEVAGAGALSSRRYDGDRIIHAEKIREQTRLKQAAIYTRLFTQEPVLTIRLVKMNIVFNPNNLFDLGAPGTVYPTAEIKDSWGSLRVASGGMLMKDWQVITLPAKGMRLLKDSIVQGPGWEIQLNKNWKIAHKDRLHAVLVSVD